VLISDECEDGIAQRSVAALQVHRTRATPPDAAFGWWFTSGKFESGWGLSQLLTALRIGGWPEADQWIVEELARLAQNPALLADVIECLSLLVHADREGWHTYGWRDEATRASQRH